MIGKLFKSTGIDYDKLNEQVKELVLSKYPDTDKFGDLFRVIHLMGEMERDFIGEPEEDPEKLAGYLDNKIVSQKGYVTARTGHEVYETRERYIMYLKSETAGKPDARMTFYKDTLNPLAKLK